MTTPHSRSLLLGGFMGTGKSTIGPLVAASANLPFVDLDSTIEAAAGKSIASIFQSDGEPAFRTLETHTLRSLLISPAPAVIALGGGSLLEPSLREQALQSATVINLVARPDTIAARIHDNSRPLLNAAPDPLARIRHLLDSRNAAYNDAHCNLRVDGRTPHDIANAVLLAWRDHPLLVRTSSITYPARITDNPVDALAELVRTVEPSSTFVVTDQNVEPLITRDAVDALRNAGIPITTTVVLTPGETHKQWPAVEQILHALISAGADRRSLVIALGGGVVSDIAGFAAAILLRGVKWIAVPTTLLSMVDAAVGGKTAVDLGLAKNSVGAFHQPAGVIVHPSFTLTESHRAYTSGLAEVVKSAAIADPQLFDLLDQKYLDIRNRDVHILREIVRRSLQVKTSIVSRDERESGERMLLNFGHSIGHALEAAGNYTRLTHGEAVSLGMVAILQFGVAKGITAPEDAERIVRVLDKLGLPTDLSREPIDEAMKLIAFDKKRVASHLRLVLLEQMGRMRIESISVDEVRAFFSTNAGKSME